MIDPITQIAAMNGWMREQREKQPPRPGPTMEAWRARIPQDIEGKWPDERKLPSQMSEDELTDYASNLVMPMAGTLSPRFAAMAAQRAAAQAEREAIRKAAQEAAEARGIKLFGEAMPAPPAAPAPKTPKPPKRVRFKDVPEQEWQQFNNTAGPDDYVYHVTHSKAAPSIKRYGLQPSAGGSLFKHGGYGEYSKGKAFVTDRDGVGFWADRVGQQLEHQFDNPPKLKVLRLPKAEAKGLQIDEIGTKDAGAKAFFSRGQLGLVMAALGLGSAGKLMPREERRGIQPL